MRIWWKKLPNGYLLLIFFNNGELEVLWLNTFKLDLGDNSGFDIDLISLDRVWSYQGNIQYASRDWSISAHWLTLKLQRWLGRSF